MRFGGMALIPSVWLKRLYTVGRLENTAAGARLPSMNGLVGRATLPAAVLAAAFSGTDSNPRTPQAPVEIRPQIARSGLPGTAYTWRMNA